MKDFEFLEHTADLKFRAYGKGLEEALANSGKALYSAICDVALVEGKEERNVSFEFEGEEELVHHWLTELIFLFSTEFFLAREFEIDLGEGKFEGKIRGEVFDDAKHKLEIEVKAATYHDLKVEEKNGEWMIQVVCDT